MIATFLALLIGADAAQAHEGDGYRRRGDPTTTTVFNPEKSVSVTVSPIHLLIPMFQVTGEFRTSDVQSVAVVGGLGSDEGRNLYEVGAQVRQYVVGDFDTGINLGAQAKYGDASYTGYDDPMASVGPFIGGKLTVALFTLDVQGGGQVVYQERMFRVGPLLNVNAGVSF